MASPAIQDKVSCRSFRLRVDPMMITDDSDCSLALHPVISNLQVDVAVVYRFDAATREFEAVAWHSGAGKPERSL
ncbi:MAG TPA: hypothetical protein VG273_19945, partial [Bryobacteraceae bacterium]|nr:hypothetical protein [Bryobacteraceae bacterium]